jgi:DNA invertase Pin-like site-specific DNA recombinase
MHAVSYCRVSSREQEETGYSLPSQEKLLAEYASRKSFKMMKVFSVAESASGSKQREVFKEMMEYMETHNIPILLCEKVDRLTRNLKEAVVANDWIGNQEDRQIHFVKQNLIVHKNAKSDERFRWDIEIVLAKKFIANLSEEVKKGQKEKLSQGWLPTKPPLGYKTIGEKGHKIHVLDGDYAPFIKKAFDYYSKGNHSLASLRAKLYEEGLRTRNGSKLSKSRLEQILKDPFYKGWMRWNDVVYENGKHEPLISGELFDKVQITLTRKLAPHYKRHSFQFGKMIKCGECNGTISAEIQKGFIYYSCKHNRPCNQKGMIREEDIETSLINVFTIFESITQEEANAIQAKIRENHQLEIEYKESTLRALNSRYTSLQRQLDILYDDRLSEKITQERWEGKQKTIVEEQAEIQKQITRLKEEETRYFELYINILDLARRAREIYEKRTPEERRLLLTHIFSNLFLRDKKASVLLKKSLERLAKRVQEKLDAKNNFELEKRSVGKAKIEFQPQNAFMLARLRQVRTHIIEEDHHYIFMTKLPSFLTEVSKDTND